MRLCTCDGMGRCQGCQESRNWRAAELRALQEAAGPVVGVIVSPERLAALEALARAVSRFLVCEAEFCGHAPDACGDWLDAVIAADEALERHPT